MVENVLIFWIFYWIPMLDCCVSLLLNHGLKISVLWQVHFASWYQEGLVEQETQLTADKDFVGKILGHS